jgi:hypothetical protein
VREGGNKDSVIAPSQQERDTDLDLDHRHRLLELCIVPRSAVDGLWDVLEHEIEVDLVGLVAIRVEEGPEVDDVRVRDEPHDLELAVLRRERRGRG